MLDGPPERWAPSAIYPDKYEVSTHGRLRRLPGRRMLGRSLDTHGYPRVNLMRNGERFATSVHRLVAMTFLPPAADGQTDVNHRDSVRHNNRVENLEWCSHHENITHAVNAGRFGKRARGAPPKLTECLVREAVALKASGWKVKAITKRFGLSSNVTLLNVFGGRTWNDITGLPYKRRKPQHYQQSGRGIA